jgi:hypothetical protein
MKEPLPAEIRRLKRDIGERLADNPFRRNMARRVGACESGTCNGCGDVCPVKTRRRAISTARPMRSLLKRGGADRQVWKVWITRDAWKREKGELAEASLGAIEKTIRRALDRLNDPSIIAVGVMDAWWGFDNWELGAQFLVSGPTRSELLDAFSKTKDIGGSLEVTAVRDLKVALTQLFGDSGKAKKSPRFMAETIGRKSRGEYYAWLASTKPGERLFRYGCDRYLHPLGKSPRKILLKPKKRHPYPWWLASSMYGSHPQRCNCRICRGQQNS